MPVVSTSSPTLAQGLHTKLAVSEIAEPTRLIPKSPQTPSGQAKAPWTVNAPDADVFQLLPGDVVKGLNRSSEAQRVLSELRYLEFYASQFGKAVGFNPNPEVMIVEDPEHQTAFRKIAGVSQEAFHGGLTRRGKKRLGLVRKELGKED